jgi:hypothetical protein
VIYPLATALVLLACGALLYWRQARLLDAYRSELRVIVEARAAGDAHVEALREQVAAQMRREQLLHDELRAAREQADRERHQLLDRIQRPEVVPYAPADLNIEDRKLHHNEYDELQGVTPGEVAAKVAEQLSPYIDEIAVSEGSPHDGAHAEPSRRARRGDEQPHAAARLRRQPPGV